MSDESKDDEVLEVIIDGRRGKLYRTSPDGRIPHGAIKVNKNSLANLRFDALRKRPLEERWPLYSSMIVSNTNILTSAVLTYNLRYKLRLTAAGGRLTCYGFACVAPALFTGLMYDTVVQKTIMEGTEPDCAVCLPTRASCINVMAGWVLPTLYSFFVTSHMARFLSSAYMPPVNQPTKLLQEWSRVSIRLRPWMGVSAIVSFAVPFVTTIYLSDAVRNLTLNHLRDSENQKRMQEESMLWGNAQLQERIEDRGKTDR